MRARETLALLLLTSCSYVLPPSDPCSLENPDRLAFIAKCDEEIAKCPRGDDGAVRGDCPALLKCETEQARVCG